MEQTLEENKLKKEPIKKLIWKLGLPMVISMVLQALYNVVDSVFVANIKDIGEIANEALTYAFPIQILMIAISVGTGVGINALLSKSLGEKDNDKVSKIVGNGIFLLLAIFLFFLLFGLFGSTWFISLFSKDEQIIKLGSSYLFICSTFSLGSIGFAIYERFLQASGKTIFSMTAQISGALINILFDYIFIFPLNMGVEGAAWATILGQFVSLFIAMAFHYLKNKEVKGKIKDFKPDFKIIKNIYSIGLSAAIMQALLSIMMAGMNAILSMSKIDSSLLVGSFGIYYKVQQIALFSCFGLSNTIITVLSFNYGVKNKQRSMECIKYGILDTLIVSILITVLFEIIARPLSMLFALSSNGTSSLIDLCEKAVRIASIGYIFMGFNVAAQGVFQALRYPYKPLITALCRLCVFTLPIAYLFTLSSEVSEIVWWTFPIAEVLTSFITLIFLKQSIDKKIKTM